MIEFIRYLGFRAIVRGLIFLLLAVWAASTTYLAIENSQRHPLLIGIDAEGTRIITQKDDPLFATETVNFIRSFCTFLYNFDPMTYDSSVGSASIYLSKDLWQREKQRILAQRKMVQEENIHHKSEIKKIFKISASAYEVLLDVEKKQRAVNQKAQLQLKLELAKVKRSEDNPWGIEVVDYEENFVR